MNRLTVAPPPEPSIRADLMAVFRSLLLRTRLPMCERDLWHSFEPIEDADFLPEIRRCRRCKLLEEPCPACGSLGPPRQGPFNLPRCDVCGA